MEGVVRVLHCLGPFGLCAPTALQVCVGSVCRSVCVQFECVCVRELVFR